MTGDVVIRPARLEDTAAMVSLVHALAEYELAPDQVELGAADLEAALFGAEPKVFAHVAEIDGAVVGVAIWFLNFSTWTGHHGIYLEDLFVRPEARRRGAGRALVTELARLAVARGYSRVEWAVLDWNEPAVAFYRRLGALAQDEWTVFRLSGAALARLGAAQPDVSREPAEESSLSGVRQPPLQRRSERLPDLPRARHQSRPTASRANWRTDCEGFAGGAGGLLGLSIRVISMMLLPDTTQSEPPT